MKKALVAISVIICLLAAGAYYWHWQESSHIISDPVDAIPTSAVVVIKYPDITKAWDVFEDQDYFDDLIQIEELGLYFSRNQLLDSLLRYDQDLKAMLANSSIWSSYHSKTSDSLLVFHAIQSSSTNNQKVLKAVNTALKPVGVITEQSFNQLSIFTLTMEDPYNVLNYTVHNGLILCSSDLELLKTSINQLTAGKSLKDDRLFSNAVSASGKNVEANLFINYAELPEYLSEVLKSTHSSSTSDAIEHFAGWTELDVNLKPEGLTCNGFSYTNDSLNLFLNLFINQAPQSINFPEFLPSTTASFLFFGIEDVLTLRTDYRNYLKSTSKLTNFDSQLDSLNEHYGVHFEESLLGWLGTSFGICITEPKQEHFAKNSYMVMEANSPDLAARLLSKLGSTIAEKNGLEVDSVVVNGKTIRQLQLSGMLSLLFGGGFEAYENPYYVVYQNHVIFGPDQQSLVVYLQYLQGDRTLAKELSFSRFVENLGSTFNLFSYHHLSRSEHIFKSYLNSEAVAVADKNKKIADSFEAIGTQISTTGKSFYSNVFLKYNPEWKETNESSWEAKTDVNPIGSPIYVKNHLTGQDEILVQDEDNALYLFSEVGQRLFKAELPEKIQGKIHQVDAFKNGRLQYLFNTKDYIYLIDRNGNQVSGYPIELSSPAVTNLAVFDYDNNRDYRLLITCKNKRIYNFDIKGNKIKGWKHTKANDLTIHPFQHFATNGKDYLVTGESNGKIHLLDRRGKNRVKVKKRVPASKNNHLQVFKSSESAFTGVYLTDEDGTIHRISVNGDVSPMDLGKFSPEHTFIVADLDKDGGPEFIFSDLNVLQIFDYKKQKVAEQRLEPSATKPFLIDLGERGIAIGYCYLDSEQLVLFSKAGEMETGFPISGFSKFDALLEDNSLTVTSAGSSSNLSIQSVR